MTNTVIVGAGPYGLSVAAHCRQSGIAFRIFGRPMDSWVAHMPKGMLLKSDGFASNISDPAGDYTLGQFCAEKGIPFRGTGMPVSLETFSSYGLAFKDRKVPGLEDKSVISIKPDSDGFMVGLDTGETFHALHVILAIGVTHFGWVPEVLANLPGQYVSHSSEHSDVTRLRGRKVVILGAGSSALDLAGLMHEAGVDVQLIARKPLKFHSKSDKPRPWWDRLRRPPSGLGPGWKSFFFANYPNVFHYLPEPLRVEAVRRVLGPSGGAFIRDKVEGRVPTLIGYSTVAARVENSKVRLTLADGAGAKREVVAEHVIAATGYKVNLEKLKFLDDETRSRIKTVSGSPALSSALESSIPGLYFVGLAAAVSFGPVMRFAFGGDFSARTVTRAVAKAAARETVTFAAKAAVTASK
ncbi:MAG: NAD(P)-binding domain-containing protein [Candidatus Sulfotelmatobacter sp.]